MKRQPSIFFGHGNPLNAIKDNEFTTAWKGIGKQLYEPTAIVMVSAHWAAMHTAVSTHPAPKTIHDFYGFPESLYQCNYPAKGSAKTAEQVINALEGVESIFKDESRGLDHGAWSVLCHVAPNADIPVVQLSINQSLTAEQQFEIGQALRPLRQQGVVIAGSGNVVHNLRRYDWSGKDTKQDWAQQFESEVRRAIESKNYSYLFSLHKENKLFDLAHPTDEHLSPLFYVLGATYDDDILTFPVEGFEGGSLSMLSILFC